jgi:uncharacterized membrane protein YphA (DoxX/SURF4 family)
LSALAILLCLGILTPAISIILFGIEVMVFRLAGNAEWRFFMLVCVIAIALAALGPGAYSFDAKLFGRREVVFRPRSTRGHL